jgi:hypothetical protein
VDYDCCIGCSGWYIPEHDITSDKGRHIFVKSKGYLQGTYAFIYVLNEKTVRIKCIQPISEHQPPRKHLHHFVSHEHE